MKTLRTLAGIVILALTCIGISMYFTTVYEISQKAIQMGIQTESNIVIAFLVLTFMGLAGLVAGALLSLKVMMPGVVFK